MCIKQSQNLSNFYCYSYIPLDLLSNFAIFTLIGLDKSGYQVNIFLISPRNKKNIDTFGLKKSALTRAMMPLHSGVQIYKAKLAVVEAFKPFRGHLVLLLFFQRK